MKEDTKTPVSSFSLFTPSKNAFMRNFKTFAILLAPSAIYELLNLITSFIKSEQVEPTGELSLALLLVMMFGFFVVVPLLLVFGALIAKLQLESAKGNVISFKKLWETTKTRIVPFIVLSFAIAIRVIGGLILFVVPGLIAIRKYVFATYIFLEDDSLSASEAMKKSAAMTAKPYSGYVWGVFGVTILLSVFGFIPFFGSLITFVLTSLYSVALPLRYLELKALKK